VIVIASESVNPEAKVAVAVIVYCPSVFGAFQSQIYGLPVSVQDFTSVVPLRTSKEILLTGAPFGTAVIITLELALRLLPFVGLVIVTKGAGVGVAVGSSVGVAVGAVLPMPILGVAVGAVLPIPTDCANTDVDGLIVAFVLLTTKTLIQSANARRKMPFGVINSFIAIYISHC
jgi:hypothetical protein